MDKKVISYIVFTVGVILLLVGGGLLYVKERNLKNSVNPVQKKGKKVEVIFSTQTNTGSTTTTKQQTVTPDIPKNNLDVDTTNSTQKRKISFKFRSSKPQSVFLIGDFNKWNKKANPMTKGDNFVWETTVLLAPGEYKYAFLVDNKQTNDPYNKKTTRLKSGKASILIIKPL